MDDWIKKVDGFGHTTIYTPHDMSIAISGGKDLQEHNEIVEQIMGLSRFGPLRQRIDELEQKLDAKPSVMNVGLGQAGVDRHYKVVLQQREIDAQAKRIADLEAEREEWKTGYQQQVRKATVELTAHELTKIQLNEARRLLREATATWVRPSTLEETDAFLAQEIDPPRHTEPIVRYEHIRNGEMLAITTYPDGREMRMRVKVVPTGELEKEPPA